MDDNRLESAKSALRNMLFYYIAELIDQGVEDPRQRVATEIGELINLSSEQLEYIYSKLSSSVSLEDNVDMCIKLLINIEKTKKLDMESIIIVRKTLEIFEQLIVNSKDYVLEGEEDNGKEN